MCTSQGLGDGYKKSDLTWRNGPILMVKNTCQDNKGVGKGPQSGKKLPNIQPTKVGS